MSNKGTIRDTQSDLDNLRYAKYLNGRTALVAQGGGQGGIFTAGVLDAFLLSNFDPFDVFYGTSAGALNICAYLCRQPGLGKSFVLDLTTDKTFFSLFSYIRQGKKMNLDWALDKICRYPYKLDLDLGRRTLGNREAFATVTEVRHIRDHYIPMLSSDWFNVMRATCAIPGLYSDEVILGEQRFVDGGVTASIPVQEAWRQDSRNIVVIRTEPVDNKEEQGGFKIPDVQWLKEPISTVHTRWNQKVGQWKKEWEGFWQDQIDKSKEKLKHHKHLDLLNGGRWLFGAGDVYRLSHLLGGKFDSGLADFLMVHYQTYSLTEEFLANPPDDCFILQIAPAKPLKSSALLSSKEDLYHDYESGVSAGYEFIRQYNATRKQLGYTQRQRGYKI